MTPIDLPPSIALPATHAPSAPWPHTPPVEPPLRRPLSPTGWPGGPARGPGPSHSPPSRPGGPNRRAGLVAALALLVVALVAVSLVTGLRVAGRDDPGTAGTAAPAAPATTTRPPTTLDPSVDPGSPGATVDPQQLAAEVARIETFVEEARGHPFKTDVQVQVVEPTAFQAQVLAVFEEEADAMRKQGDLLKAFGLIPDDLDVVEAQRNLLSTGVLGYYDPRTKELFVGGDHIGPFLRQVIAHELTHALDDQYFDLDRPEIDSAKDGSDFAFLALVEGSAKRVENDYVAQLSADDQSALMEEQLQLGLGQLDGMLGMPLVLAQIQMMPYDYGEPFVRAIVDRHGIAGLDAAFTALPTTSEQVLDNDKFDVHEPAIVVDAPDPGGRAVEDDGVLGELMTGLILQGGVTTAGDLGDLDDLGQIDPRIQDLIDRMLSGEADPQELQDLLDELEGELEGGLGGSGGLGSSGLGAVPTIEGWGGDHYVLVEGGDAGVCVQARWEMDDAAALDELTAALSDWATSRGGNTNLTTSATSALLYSCSRPTGSAAPSTPDTSPAPTTPRTPPTTPPRSPSTPSPGPSTTRPPTQS